MSVFDQGVDAGFHLMVRRVEVLRMIELMISGTSSGLALTISGIHGLGPVDTTAIVCWMEDVVVEDVAEDEELEVGGSVGDFLNFGVAHGELMV